MASYKLNIARIRGCPPAAELGEAIEGYGLPEYEEYGVLDCTSGQSTVYGTIVRKTQQTIQRLNAEAGEVTDVAVEKATVYPFGVNPAREVLETYAGSAGGIAQVAAFLAGHLALPTIVELIEIDVLTAIDKLASRTEKFQLRSARVSDYAHNSFMNGTYGPKFLDTEHGKDFLGEYADYIKAASVCFAGPSGRINVALTPAACFSFSCSEDDHPTAQGVLRKLI